jgi:type I restriction enzyme, S subunit
VSAVSQAANHWAEASIESVASVEFGTRVTKKVDGGTRYPVYGGGGATFSMDEYNREDCYIVSRFGMSEECVRRVDGKFFLNDSGLTVRTRDEDLLFQRFLDLYLLRSQARIFDLGRGAAQKNLNVEAFRQLVVPLPPLDEQKRIVAVLDQAFAALDLVRDSAKANRDDLSELEKALILELLSVADAKSSSLGDVCEIYQPRTISTKEMVPDGPYVVFGANGKIGRYSDYNHADPEVLVTCRGATCGQVNVSEPFSWVTGNAMVVRPKSDAIRKDFLEEVLRNSVDWSEVITGAAQPQITRASLAPISIPVPEASAQKDVVIRIKALRLCLSQLRELAKNKLVDIAILRQSLLQAAFSGQLT